MASTGSRFEVYEVEEGGDSVWEVLRNVTTVMLSDNWLVRALRA